VVVVLEAPDYNEDSLLLDCDMPNALWKKLMHLRFGSQVAGERRLWPEDLDILLHPSKVNEILHAAAESAVPA
jgi:hypothetical protein